jgi:hypothetical protein
MYEDAPTIERIPRKVDGKRESHKKASANIRKSGCYKGAYTRKQALTQKSTVLKQGYASYLEIYKCKICRYWHLTSTKSYA